MKNKDLRSLAKRLRAEDPISTEEREFLAEELERMAAEKRGPGKPEDSPDERVRKRMTRALVAEGIYQGTFPEHLYPPDLDERARPGSRTEADALAAKILKVSASAIEKARRSCLDGEHIYPLGIERRGKPMDSKAFKEFIALLLRLLRR